MLLGLGGDTPMALASQPVMGQNIGPGITRPPGALHATLGAVADVAQVFNIRQFPLVLCHRSLEG
jgi:hypothetical protein